MSEEGARELRISSNLRELFVNPRPQLSPFCKGRRATPVDDQMYRLLAIEHQLLERRHK